MNDILKPIIEITEKIVNKYSEIAQSFIDNEESAEKNKLITQLKELVFEEDLEYEILYKNTGLDIIKETLNILFSKDDTKMIVKSRILTKLKDKINVIIEEKEIKKVSVIDMPEKIYERNYIFFLNKLIDEGKEKENLIMKKFFAICTNGLSEKRLIEEKFNPSLNTFTVDDNTDKEVLYEYLLAKRSYVEKNINGLLGKIRNIDNINKREILNNIKLQFRAICFMNDGQDYDELVTYIKEFQKNLENKESSVFLKEILSEIENDNKKYPKVSIGSALFKNYKFLDVSKKILSYYDRLADLEISYYNGIDTSFEKEKLVNVLDLAINYETKLYLEVMLENDDKIVVSPQNQKLQKRVLEKIKKVSDNPYLISQKTGVPEAKIKIKYPLNSYIEHQLSKNLIYFYDEEINQTKGNVRDYLIRKKYSFISKNIYLEETCLEEKYCFTKELIMFQNNFGMNEEEKEKYYHTLNKSSLEYMDKILDIVKDYEGEEMINLLFDLKANLKTFLYSLTDDVYLESRCKLEQLISDDGIHNIGKKIIIEALEEIDILRKKYPKLIL